MNSIITLIAGTASAVFVLSLLLFICLSALDAIRRNAPSDGGCIRGGLGLLMLFSFLIVAVIEVVNLIVQGG